ncbi:MAG: hypothetical protein EPN84_02025 [Legionella sp.]|nr:MAG: hypothetical protein EPN84_02025 [Legionella sp.]
MDYIAEVLEQLTSRLPELEWKISSLNTAFSHRQLPRGLFQPQSEYTGASCVAEIKRDLEALAQQTNPRSANYLATRINQKINVLVTLCQIHSRNKPEEKAYFGMQMISTRQQWIQNLESDIELLQLQQQAILRALEQLQGTSNQTAILNAQWELGEVEKRLTLAREKLQQAVV